MRDASTGSGHTGAAIEADLPALHRIAANLRELSQEFADRDGTLQTLLADPDLGDALRHAERDWSTQRHRIRTFLLGVADAVSSSAQAYEQVEQQLVRGVRPNG